MPNVMLITDNDATVILGYGQQERQEGRNPNPYEGIITAGGPTSAEYDASANWKYCAAIYKQETGKAAPNAGPSSPVPTARPSTPTGASTTPASCSRCSRRSATGSGKNLNVTNWVHTVNTYGTIRDYGGGQYASLHTGKYDDDDTFRLEKFDSIARTQGRLASP